MFFSFEEMFFSFGGDGAETNLDMGKRKLQINIITWAMWEISGETQGAGFCFSFDESPSWNRLNSTNKNKNLPLIRFVTTNKNSKLQRLVSYSLTSKVVPLLSKELSSRWLSSANPPPLGTWTKIFIKHWVSKKPNNENTWLSGRMSLPVSAMASWLIQLLQIWNLNQEFISYKKFWNWQMWQYSSDVYQNTNGNRMIS